jgi:VWFA-related protein
MRALLLVALGTFVLGVIPGAAQGPGSATYDVVIDQDKDNQVFSAWRERDGKRGLYVTVQFKLVRRADGRVVTDVPREEIQVLEDGLPVAELEVNQPHSQRLTTVLALDVSGSMSRSHKMDEARKAALTFLDRLDERAQTGLILFDHEVPREGDALAAARLRRPGTPRDELRALIHAAQPRGGTAYLDAASRAVGMLKQVEGRKAVVLLTDGVDMNSRRKLPDVIAEAQTLGVPIYTLGVGEPGRNEPVTTVLVLDQSGSMRKPANDADRMPKIEALRRAASRFVELMRPNAKTTLLPFSSTVELPRPFSADQAALKRSIEKLRPEGGTLLYDATYAGLETLAAARPAGKKAVVVLTDGKDEAPGSRRSAALVIERAQEAKVPLYMLGFGRRREINADVMDRMAKETGGQYYHAEDQQKLLDIFENLSIQLHDDGIDEESLRKLARDTGGEYYNARDASKLRLIYERLAEELQSTYTVTYLSRRSSQDGTARGIDIRVVRGGAQISTGGRTGYNVSGVVVPDMDHGAYLMLLAVLGGLLLFPAALKRVYRGQGGV